jgi:outer membrane protein assembly factor BamB
MRALWKAFPMLLVLTAAASGQDRERLWSDPAMPEREALDRLNLELVWRADVPMAGRRDGFVSIQHTGRQILVQTRGGIVALYNAETESESKSARLIWRVRVGEPFAPSAAPAFNSTSVYVVSGTMLYALDRSNGAPQWDMKLPGGLTAPPACDEDQVYILTGEGWVYAFHPYIVENVEKRAPYSVPSSYGQPDYSAKSKEVSVASIVPVPSWSVLARFRLDLPAVQSVDTLVVPSPSGTLLGITKYPQENKLPEGYRFPLESPLSAGVGALDNTAYCPGRDGYVTAFEMSSAKVQWRQLIGTGLNRTPAVTKQDLFVVSEQHGMARLDRATGEPLWRLPSGQRIINSQPEADRFLAANPKFVYAQDRSGRLLILDRTRGLILSRFDTRDFTFPVVNEQTDRLYLAANNGVILCLRDRDYPDVDKQRQRDISVREKEAGKTLQERIKEMQQILKTPISLEDSDPVPLGRFLDTVRKTYRVKPFLSEKSYREQNLVPPTDVKVKVPKVDKAPLSEVLNKVLMQVNSGYIEVGDQIFIIPKRVIPGAPMGGM